MKQALLFVFCASLLAACAEPKKDYEASSRCQDLGLKPGSESFDSCVSEEKAARMLRQQREEFERMKQDERDWKMRRY
ncbi:MAG: hypothetical protein LW823_02020 [Rickettsiales bacterium]|nr:hypothetical protein [Rickettsiales bacterium]